jgi:transposase-like protein
VLQRIFIKIVSFLKNSVINVKIVGIILKVSNVLVLNWIKNFGEKVEELRKNDEISVTLLMLQCNNKLSILN